MKPQKGQLNKNKNMSWKALVGYRWNRFWKYL